MIEGQRNQGNDPRVISQDQKETLAEYRVSTAERSHTEQVCAEQDAENAEEISDNIEERLFNLRLIHRILKFDDYERTLNAGDEPHPNILGRLSRDATTPSYREADSEELVDPTEQSKLENSSCESAKTSRGGKRLMKRLLLHKWHHR